MNSLQRLFLLVLVCISAQVGSAQNLPPIYFSSQDNMRGWDWDGNTASYVATLDGKSYLFVRLFNGQTFGPVKSKLTMSGADLIRGWSWDGNTASYLGLQGGETYLFVRPFDGSEFGPVERKIRMSGRDNFYSWHWDGHTARYHAFNGGQMVAFRRSFDGVNLGAAVQEKVLGYSAEQVKGVTVTRAQLGSYTVFSEGKTYVYPNPPALVINPEAW